MGKQKLRALQEPRARGGWTQKVGRDELMENEALKGGWDQIIQPCSKLQLFSFTQKRFFGKVSLASVIRVTSLLYVLTAPWASLTWSLVLFWFTW